MLISKLKIQVIFETKLSVDELANGLDGNENILETVECKQQIMIIQAFRFNFKNSKKYFLSDWKISLVFVQIWIKTHLKF